MADQSQSDRDDFVFLRAFPDITLAHLAAGVLESAGIRAKFVDEYAAGFYPLGAVIGGVKLFVPRTAVDDADEILQRRF